MQDSDDITAPVDAAKRDFLKSVGGAGLGAGLGLGFGLPAAALAQSISGASQASTRVGAPRQVRRAAAYDKRVAAAQQGKSEFVLSQPVNDDEYLPGNIGVFSRGLPHNDLGEVDPEAYRLLTYALATGDKADLSAVPMGGGAKFALPRLGFAFSPFGCDPQGLLAVPAAPAFGSAQTAAEMAELYWAALTRDVPFDQYDTDPTIAAACADLSKLPGFNGPKVDGKVTPRTFLRAGTPGERVGPYVSQFLLRPIPQGPFRHEPKLASYKPDVEYLTSYADWLAAQRGQASGPTATDGQSRYIHGGRGLCAYVGSDFTGQPSHDAWLILSRLPAPFSAALPSPASNEGGTSITATILELAYRATSLGTQACFWQKWQVHRRIRAEAYGGRVHNLITGAKYYPVHPDLLQSAAPAAVFAKFGTYLLPMAYKVGCPMHPAYPAGHTMFAAAGVTILKAFYKNDFVLTNNVVPSADGLSTEPYTGGETLTVGTELDKLAANISMSRISGGVHWRSDCDAGMVQGEAAAINLLAELRALYPDQFGGFSLTRFDGTTITI